MANYFLIAFLILFGLSAFIGIPEILWAICAIIAGILLLVGR